jgi:16S rRNA (guanine966-N2)-methyltransferase
MSSRPPGTVRIIAGARKGRRLKFAPEAGVRPTSDMVREAVFDVLGAISGLRVLDLFAGSGALGLEALSRGAHSCVFVENDAHAAAMVRTNIATLDYAATSRVIFADYNRALATLVTRAAEFDLLFVDPPYRMLAEVEATLAPLLTTLLAPSGIVVVEGPRSASSGFGHVPIFERVYGETRITMIRVGRSDA